MKNILFYSFLLLFYTACSQPEPNTEVSLEPDKRKYTLETVVANSAIIWSMAWLPDGSMLIAEKGGDMYLVKDTDKVKINNVPEVYNRGQGGLLDVVLHPDYENNGWIYITFASTEGTGEGGNTKLIRAKLQDDALVSIQDLYKGMPNSTRGQHFGSRIAFDDEGYLYFTIGDRGNHPENPQDITRDGGKVYRLHDDGKIPADNPFVGEANAKEAVYSYGHRNPQGMAKNPATGKIWLHEHGPKGGDEINIVKKAINYGWPVISYGINYDGSILTEETEKPGMEQPIYHWTPSIAPSGMAFVTSDNYPDWKGHLLAGSLKFQYLELVRLKGNAVVGREIIAEDVGRLRDVRQGPDGYIYMSVEGEGIVKIIPKQ